MPKIPYHNWRVSMSIVAKCLLWSYLYLCINAAACCISFAFVPEGHYLQLVYTIRSFSIFGIIDGLLIFIAILCGRQAYEMIFSYLLSFINYFYSTTNTFTVLFFILCFISYLDFIYGISLVYGILNAIAIYFANSALEELYKKIEEVKYYMVVDCSRPYSI